MIVRRTSVFPASRNTVFQKVQQLETLQLIASPYASFEPVEHTSAVWKEGAVSSFRFKLFRFIPYGIHTIRIVRFDPDRIESRESNTHVPVWNHTIFLDPVDSSHTKYTDLVEILAGRKTFFIWLWAEAFYAHRQKKWIRLLTNEKRGR